MYISCWIFIILYLMFILKIILKTNIFIQGMAKLPVTASRWLQPVWTCVTVTLVNNPPISCGLINIWCSVEWISGGLPHCPCWFEPQQKTWPEAEHIEIYHHIELSSFTTCHLMAVKLKQYFGEGREAISGYPFFSLHLEQFSIEQSKVILVCFGFTLLCCVIGPENLHDCLNN